MELITYTYANRVANVGGDGPQVGLREMNKFT